MKARTDGRSTLTVEVSTKCENAIPERGGEGEPLPEVWMLWGVGGFGRFVCCF